MLESIYKLPEWQMALRTARKLRKGQEIYAWLREDYRKMLGDQALVKAVTGGAHTSKDVIKFISELMSEGNDTGVFNAYGATEFPGISVNGEISEVIDLKLEDVDLAGGEGFLSSDLPFPRGQILVRSQQPYQTLAYWKRPDLSEKAWTHDGFYKTGDIGMLETLPNGNDTRLHVLGRLSNLTELYVNGDSVWTPLAQLQDNVYSSVKSIDQLFLTADRNQPFPVAVVVPSPIFVAQLTEERANSNNMSNCSNDAELSEVILMQLQGAGKRAKLKSYEIPMAVVLEHKTWTADNGYMTATGKMIYPTSWNPDNLTAIFFKIGKLRRSALQQGYLSQVEAAYSALETKSGSESNNYNNDTNIRIPSAKSQDDPASSLVKGAAQRLYECLTVTADLEAKQRPFRQKSVLLIISPYHFFS